MERMRSCNAKALRSSMPGSNTVNSSPPMRAAQAGGSTALASTSPTARSMALLIVHNLEPVQINRNDGQRPRPLAGDTIEFFRIEGPVTQLRQDVMLAKVLQVGFGLFARRDVHQRQQHQPPVRKMVCQHRKLH